MPRLIRKKTRHTGIFREKGPTGWRWLVEASKRLAPGERKILGKARLVRSKRLPLSTPIETVIMARAELVGELAAEVDAATAPTRSRSGITVAGYVARWLARKRATLRPGTYDHYVDVMGMRVLPVLGGMLCVELTRDDVVRWTLWARQQKSRYDRPYADDTLASWWRPIQAMLKDMAADLGLPDPTVRVQRPRSKRRAVRESETLTAKQLAALLATVRRLYPQWHAEVYILAFTGVRPGELYALRWQDVDAERGVIHVARSVRRGHVSETKTGAAREVALTPGIHAVLDAHAKVGELIFPAEGGGYRMPESIRKVLRLCAGATGISTRVGPQVLRRTLNTLLVEQGTAGTIIRAQIGHTTEAMTDLYAGIHPVVKADAIGAVERSVSVGKPE